MAATTPTLYYPTTETGMRLAGRIALRWSQYAGAGALASQRVRVYDDGSKTTTLWDSKFVAVDGHLSGDGWLDTWPELWWSAAPSTTYYWSVTVRNDVPEDSSESSLGNFTMEAASLTSARWREGQ